MPDAVQLGAVRVSGLRELNRMLAKAGPEVKAAVRESALKVAEPVRRDAQILAATQISGIRRERAAATIRVRRRGPRSGQAYSTGRDWSKMRIGVTLGSVYVAPTQRGTKVERKQRPNLAPLLMDKAMRVALDRHADELELLAMEHIDRIWTIGA